MEQRKALPRGGGGALGDAGFPGCGIGFGVVAGAGPDGHLAVMGGVGFDADGAVAAEAGGFAGVVANRVLVANVFGDFGGNGVDVVEGVREEGEATGFVGEKLESAAGAVYVNNSRIIRSQPI